MKDADAITLRQLRALGAVAAHGSITAAARFLRLTPPAVHSQIKGLEALAGAALLTRTTDAEGSHLTDAGRQMLEAAERVDAILSQTMARVKAGRAGAEGRVVLGVVSTAKYFAPGLVRDLRLLAPGIELGLEVGNREDILREMDRQRFDLAIMGRPPRSPAVEALPIGPHPHGLVAAPGHRLAHLRALSAADLAGEVFLSREEGSGTRMLMTRYLDRIGDGMPFTLQVMGSNETIKQAVRAGLGVGFLSLHTVAEELSLGTLVPLDAPQLPVERHWFLVRPLALPPQPATLKVMDLIRSLRGSFLPALPPAVLAGGR